MVRAKEADEKVWMHLWFHELRNLMNTQPHLRSSGRLVKH